MGVLLSTRKNHVHDYPSAVRLLRQSAAARFVPAIHSLGLLLNSHPELADSHEESRSLFELASSAGCWKSSVALGALARDGGGASDGAESAFYHFQIAILQGGDDARHLLSNDLLALEGKLTENQQNALKSEAGAWYGKHNTAVEFVFQAEDSERGKWLTASSLAEVSKGLHAGILINVPSS